MFDREKKGPPGREFAHLNPHDLSPVPNEVFAEIMSGKEEERNRSYAELVDQYHGLFQKERAVRRRNPQDPTLPVLDAERDALHQQIIFLAESLGRNKESVTVDFIRREGNLGEYGLPEYGVVTADDLWNDFSFDSLDVDATTQRITRSLSETEVHGRRARFFEREDGWATPEATEKELERRSDETWNEPLPEGGVIATSSGLKQDEVAIILGTSSTNDINLESVEIQPKDYYERLRRCQKIVDELGGRVFAHTTGAYHITTTLLGVAVPKGDMERVAGLLRNQGETFGVREDELSQEAIQRDHQYQVRKIVKRFIGIFGERSIALRKGFERYLDLRARMFGEDGSDWEDPLDELIEEFKPKQVEMEEEEQYDDWDEDERVGRKMKKGKPYSRKQKHKKL